jgi:hypothetical protein
MKKKRAPELVKRAEWKDTNYVKAYELAKSGLSERQVARSLGVSLSGFQVWKRNKPALQDALKRAKAGGGEKVVSFREYVFKHLPPHLQELWNKINACDGLDNAFLRVEALLSDAGKNARQHIFLYALTASNFNLSEACRKSNVNKKTYENWIRYDPDFADLVQEIHWHKKNFFENKLIELADEGDVHATVFANRTFNADLGYGDKMKHEVSGQINVSVNVVPVQELDLDIETRREVLAALRRAKEKTIDAQDFLPQAS